MPTAVVSALWLRPVNTQTQRSHSSWPNFKCTYKKKPRDAVEEGQAFDSHTVRACAALQAGEVAACLGSQNVPF